MDEKIKSAKVAILARIEKAVSDETKSLSAETLMTMANIVSYFDGQEMYKKEPKYDIGELVKKVLDKANSESASISVASAEKGEI